MVRISNYHDCIITDGATKSINYISKINFVIELKLASMMDVLK
jgi:hypothetical protein